MSESFDPYHRWLGIPPEDQPPTHYRLLGVAMFESDPDVIQGAADRQMAHVQTFKTGKYSEYSQQVLNRLASAKLCLLNADKKATYDKTLRAQMRAKPAGNPASRAAAALPRAQLLEDEPAHVPAGPAQVEPAGGGIQPWHIAAGVGGLGVLVFVILAMVMIFQKDDTPVVRNTPGTEEPATPAQPSKTIDPPKQVDPPKRPDTPTTPPEVPKTPTTPPEVTTPPVVPPVTPPKKVEPPKQTEPPKQVEPPNKTEPPKKDPPRRDPELTDDAIIIKRTGFGGRFDLSDLVARAEAESAGGAGPAPAQEVVREIVKIEVVKEEEKSEIPPREKQKEALDLIRDVFQEDYAKASTPLEKSNLARHLLKQAAETKEDPTARFTLLTEARDLALDSGSANTAMLMVDSISRLYKIDRLAMKTETLKRGAETAKTAPVHRSIAANSLALIEDAIVSDNYQVADELLNLGLDAARKARDSSLVKLASTLRDELGVLEEQYKQVDAAVARLKENPDDSEANLIVGRYQCFVSGDWANGLPQLAKCSDAKLRAAAEADLAVTDNAVEQAKVGDLWWDLTEAADELAKPQLLARAGHYYTKALGTLSGLTKAKVESRIKKIEESSGGTAVAAIGVDPKSIENEKTPLEQAVPGVYVVVQTERRSNKAAKSKWEFKSNHDAYEDGKLMGQWEVIDLNRVKITYANPDDGTVFVKYTKNQPTGGTRTTGSGTFKWDITRLYVVAVWEHKISYYTSTRTLTFYSNGRVNDPDGLITWAIKGNQLQVTVPDAANEFYIRTFRAVVAKGGQAYAGEDYFEYDVIGRRLPNPKTPDPKIRGRD